MDFEIRFTFTTEKARAMVEEIIGSTIAEDRMPGFERMVREAVDEVNAGGADTRFLVTELLATKMIQR